VFFNYRNQSNYISYKFLATSNTYSTAGHSFRVGSVTAAETEQEVCEAVQKKLQPIGIPEPTREIWGEAARGFYEQRDFQYCIGSTDGKHVTL
jgi:protein-L-isoaspartate O-methyltransferase